MFWHKYVGPLSLLFACSAAEAGGYIVAIGAEADTEDSRALSAFGEIAVGDSTWLSAAAATSRTDARGNRFDAIQADAGIDYLFDPVGARFAIGYWGDSDVLDSVDLRASIYVKNDRFLLSADFERRDYDLTVGLPLIGDTRTIGFHIDGVGFDARLQTGDRASVYLGGMWYDDPEDASLPPRLEELRFLSLSRLILAHGLLERKLHAGVEIEFGLRALDFRYSNWRDAAERGQLDSFGVGFLMPLGASGDIELRLSRDESDAFGDTTVLSVFLYFFGGS